MAQLSVNINKLVKVNVDFLNQFNKNCIKPKLPNANTLIRDEKYL